MARFRRSTRGFRRAKRNAERVIRAGISTVAAESQQVAYTYEALEACVVRSIKLDIGAVIGPVTTSGYVLYALVHVREGYNANVMNWPALTDDMYNPTADVLISGVLTDSAVEDHKSNYIGRKLKKGDRVALLVRSGFGPSTVTFEMNFSVLT